MEVLTQQREAASGVLPERRAGGANVALRAVQAALATAVGRAKLHSHAHVTAET